MTLSRKDMHPYQDRATGYMIDNLAVFGVMGLGLGKTVSTLTAWQTLFDQFMISRTLIIAPKRVAMHVWPNEIKKWQHLSGIRPAVAIGTPAQRSAAINRGAPITIINRENVKWLVDHQAKKKKWPWDMVVVDESTSFKTSSSSRFKALKKVRSKISRIVLLTATPTPNSLLEIWAQMYLIDQGEALGRTFSGFRLKYFDQDYMGYNWDLKPGAEEEIRAAVAPYTLVMRTEDYLTLPPKVERVIPVHLPPAAMNFYRELAKELLAEIAGEEITAMNSAVLCNKLQQAAQGAVYDEEGIVRQIHDAKLDALEDLIEAAGEPVLIAYGYKHDFDRIKEKFPAAVEAREPGALERWDKGRIKILCCHPASAGHGLNLQAGGRHLINFSLNWSGELDEQMGGRLHRQGQKETVFIHRLVAVDTIDERILESLGNRDINQRNFVRGLVE